MPLAAESDAMHRRAAAAVLEPVRPALRAPTRTDTAIDTIVEPRAPAQTRAHGQTAAAALVAWLNTEARSHLRPGCRIAVVGSSAPALAGELTRRGYDACAASAPEGADAPRGRFDFVVVDSQWLRRGSALAGEALSAAANLARAHGGLILLGEGAQAGGAAETLASLGFAPASTTPTSASMCWRRRS